MNEQCNRTSGYSFLGLSCCRGVLERDLSSISILRWRAERGDCAKRGLNPGGGEGEDNCMARTEEGFRKPEADLRWARGDET